MPEKAYRTYRDLRLRLREAKEGSNEKRVRKKEESVEELRNETVEKKGKKSGKADEKELRSEKKRPKKESKEEEKEVKKEKKHRKKEEEKEEADPGKKNKKERKKPKSSDEEDPEDIPVVNNEKKRKKEDKNQNQEAEVIKKAKRTEERAEKPNKSESKEPKKSEEKAQEKKISKKEQPIEEIAEPSVFCECRDKRVCLPMECGHSICRFCLQTLLKKQLSFGKIKFRCPLDKKKLPITLQMVSFTEVKEKYVRKFKDLSQRFESKDEERKEEKIIEVPLPKEEPKPVVKVKYDEFCMELSDNSQYMDNLAMSELNESFSEKPQVNAFSKNVKCPTCFKILEIDPSKGNLIACDGEFCKKKDIKFCLCCKKILSAANEIKAHFPQMRVESPCVDALAKGQGQKNIVVIQPAEKVFVNGFEKQEQCKFLGFTKNL